MLCILRMVVLIRSVNLIQTFPVDILVYRSCLPVSKGNETNPITFSLGEHLRPSIHATYICFFDTTFVYSIIPGDLERQLSLPVTPLCDRYSTTVAKIQSGMLQNCIRCIANVM